MMNWAPAVHHGSSLLKHETWLSLDDCMCHWRLSSSWGVSIWPGRVIAHDSSVHSAMIFDTALTCKWSLQVNQWASTRLCLGHSNSFWLTMYVSQQSIWLEACINFVWHFCPDSAANGPKRASEGDRSRHLCIMWWLADVLGAMLIVHMSVVDHGSMLLDDDKQAIPFVLFFPIAS